MNLKLLMLRRLVMTLPLLLVVSMVTFGLQDLLPGDEARAILGSNGTSEQYTALRDKLLLNQPVWEQYWHYLTGMLHGSLGTSVFTGQSVTTAISQSLPVTISLAVAGTLLATAAGIAVGVWSATSGRRIRTALNTLTGVGFSVPTFVLALALLIMFAIEIPVFPASGYVSPGISTGGWLRSITLPAVALAVYGVAGVAKMTEESLSSAFSQPYIRTLRASGVPRLSIIWRHALRNAASPILSVLGLLFIGILSGTVVVEIIFDLPGLGNFVVSAVSNHDVVSVEGVAFTYAVIVVIMNLLIDLAQMWLNPKVRAA